ncbi:MAG: hypothetical protein RL376_237 [Verrucomicrobiota bacterium]
MKIALTFGAFLPVPPALGGATEKIWTALAERLAARGHHITAYSRLWPHWPARETLRGVNHHRLPGHDHYPRLWQNLLLDLRWSLRLRKLIEPDALVITHNLTLPLLLRLPALRHPAPVAIVLGRMPKGRLRLYPRLDRIYATSQAVASRAASESPRHQDSLRLLSNGIDWPLFQSSIPRPASPVIHLGFAGRIHPEKGLHLLIAALVQLHRSSSPLPPWKLTLLGPATTAEGGGGDAYLHDLKISVQSAGLQDRITFLPPLWNPAELAAFYQSLDLFLYPSLAEQGETFGVSVAEAMAAGAVPLVSRLDCFRDLLGHDYDTLNFDHRSPDPACALAARLRDLLTARPLLEVLSSRLRFAARRFDYAPVAASLEADLETLKSVAG